MVSPCRTSDPGPHRRPSSSLPTTVRAVSPTRDPCRYSASAIQYDTEGCGKHNMCVGVHKISEHRVKASDHLLTRSDHPRLFRTGKAEVAETSPTENLSYLWLAHPRGHANHDNYAMYLQLLLRGAIVKRIYGTLTNLYTRYLPIFTNIILVLFITYQVFVTMFLP